MRALLSHITSQHPIFSPRSRSHIDAKSTKQPSNLNELLALFSKYVTQHINDTFECFDDDVDDDDDDDNGGATPAPLLRRARITLFWHKE